MYTGTYTNWTVFKYSYQKYRKFRHSHNLTYTFLSYNRYQKHNSNALYWSLASQPPTTGRRNAFWAHPTVANHPVRSGQLSSQGESSPVLRDDELWGCWYGGTRVMFGTGLPRQARMRSWMASKTTEDCIIPKSFCICNLHMGRRWGYST